jgi:hypothetical protein
VIFVEIAAQIASGPAVGTSSIEPRLLIGCGPNIFDERSGILVQAMSTVVGDLDSSGLDE